MKYHQIMSSLLLQFFLESLQGHAGILFQGSCIGGYDELRLDNLVLFPFQPLANFAGQMILQGISITIFNLKGSIPSVICKLSTWTNSNRISWEFVRNAISKAFYPDYIRKSGCGLQQYASQMILMYSYWRVLDSVISKVFLAVNQ